jgi:hypothetical protein
LLVVLALAAGLRIGMLLLVPNDMATPDDSSWYLDGGELLITNAMGPSQAIPFAPLYAIVAGTAQHLFGRQPGILAIRLLQVGLGTLMCALVWRIARQLAGDEQIAAVASIGVALSPAFLIDNTMVLTETLFMCLTLWALSIFVAQSNTERLPIVAVAGLLGLATLTRAVVLLFPGVLALHLAITMPRRQAARQIMLLFAVYGMVVGSWTVYNKVKLDRVVIGASGISDLLLAATVGYTDSRHVDTSYAQHNGGQVPIGAARDAVAFGVFRDAVVGNPVDFVMRRFRLLVEALLQPSQTVFFPGESLKDLARGWLQSDRSLTGLLQVLNGEAFFPKALLYLSHYLALFLGVVGMALTVRQWRIAGPLIGFVVYILSVHMLLLALPRYLFPVMPLFWVFAGVAIIRLWRHAQRSFQLRVLQPVLGRKSVISE